MTRLRKIGTVDTTTIALGAIIGAGIFVASGEAAGFAGPAFILALPIAGLIACFSGLSSAQLGAVFPKAGGTYEFAGRTIKPAVGFMAGWLYLLAGVTASSTYVLAFAGYLAPLVGDGTLRLIAFLAAGFATAINYFGIRISARVNTWLVVGKIGLLLVFVALGAAFVELDNLDPFAPQGMRGMAQAAALLFFAYTGFARPVTMVEEVSNPRKTLPRAVLISLLIAIVVYMAVSFVAVGIAGPGLLAVSPAPLADALGEAVGFPGTVVVLVGALTAIISVLLTEIIGLSRVVLAMARRNDLPPWLGMVHARYRVPTRAVLAVGIIVALLSTFADLTSVLAASSLALLVYYGLTNLSALFLGRRRIYHPVIPLVGLISCIGLSFFLPQNAIIINAATIIVGLGYYFYRTRPKSGRT